MAPIYTHLTLILATTLVTTAPAESQESPPTPKVGHLVEWEGWSFRWSLRKIEGVVLVLPQLKADFVS